MIEIKHLCKSYDKKPVLEDVNLSVRRGSIMGLLGPNGAGKTTLISILTGVIGKDSGNITIGGLDLDHELGSYPVHMQLCAADPGFLSATVGLRKPGVLRCPVGTEGEETEGAHGVLHRYGKHAGLCRTSGWTSFPAA